MTTFTIGSAVEDFTHVIHMATVVREAGKVTAIISAMGKEALFLEIT